MSMVRKLVFVAGMLTLATGIAVILQTQNQSPGQGPAGTDRQPPPPTLSRPAMQSRQVRPTSAEFIPTVASVTADTARILALQPPPCKEIANICQKAGFVPGGARNGNGLWIHCIIPIMEGRTSVLGATRTLPVVNPLAVADCKAKNPKFGTGAVDSRPK